MFVQEITSHECRRALLGATFGRLACAHGNQPYIVPVYFAVEGEYLYSFSMPGQKIDWMRENPLVCLQIDSVQSWNDWTSIVVFGQYEELPDTPDSKRERLRTHQLLQRRPMWWQPGAVAVETAENNRDATPIIYRISIERVTGHRGVPAQDETSAAPAMEQKGGWLSQLLHRSSSRS